MCTKRREYTQHARKEKKKMGREEKEKNFKEIMNIYGKRKTTKKVSDLPLPFPLTNNQLSRGTDF